MDCLCQAIGLNLLEGSVVKQHKREICDAQGLPASMFLIILITCYQVF